MLQIGITGRADLVVSEEDTAVARKSGTLPVFATPALAELVELACWESIAKHLDDGQTTVGTHLDLHHTAPTCTGTHVSVESRLVKVDGRRLTFEAIAADEAGEIARATHERVIVDAERFMTKAITRIG